MASINKVILIGNLGKDPEVRYLEGGAIVANFSIATTESYKDKQGERRESTEWHNIILWNSLAQVAEKYLKKGNPVYIEGRIRTEKYADKETGQEKHKTVIIGSSLTMLGSKQDNHVTKEHTAGNPSHPVADDVEDLPF